MREFIRIPVFCKEKLEGFFRYADKFQLYPFSSNFIEVVDEEVSKPMLLEFSFENLSSNQNSNLLIKTAEKFEFRPDYMEAISRFGNEATRIINFLTVCTNHEFSIYSHEKCWVRENEFSKSYVGFKEFNYPQLESEHPIRIEKLSDDLPFDPIQSIDYFKYIENGVKGSGNVISIHSELSPLFNKYYSLSSKNKAKVDAICSLFRSGIRIDGYSKSIPFIVFTSCIEALTDIEFEDENKSIKYSCDCQFIEESPFECRKCSKPIWGMSFKFKEILRRYAEDSEVANSLYNKWYSIRSGIVHYGKLLLADIEIGWDNEEKRIQQSIDLIKVKQITKITIINWLLQSKKAN